MNAKLQKSSGVIISNQTIRRELNKQNVFAFSPLKRPLLSQKNQISRFELRSKWVGKPHASWNRVVWSDECKFNLTNSDRCSHVWRKAGYSPNPKYSLGKKELAPKKWQKVDILSVLEEVNIIKCFIIIQYILLVFQLFCKTIHGTLFMDQK
jgi:hypothetical protein